MESKVEEENPPALENDPAFVKFREDLKRLNKQVAEMSPENQERVQKVFEGVAAATIITIGKERKRRKHVDLHIKERLSNSAFWKHRSTWMGVAVIAAILGLVVGALFPGIIFAIVFLNLMVSMFSVIAAVIAIVNAAVWLWSSSGYDYKGKGIFNNLLEWIAGNKLQVAVAGVGIALAMVGLGLIIAFCVGAAPFMLPVYAVAGGALVFSIIVCGPLTFADAFNRFWERRFWEAEKEALNSVPDGDEKRESLVTDETPSGSDDDVNSNSDSDSSGLGKKDQPPNSNVPVVPTEFVDVPLDDGGTARKEVLLDGKNTSVLKFN